ncbi:VOC family protein [Candidatus Woesearchaeota archaeon]|nr:VOC family protein [Candidatus Woesearchaeota archaeon]
MKNAINWFELPTKDFERAMKFYNTIFGIKIQVQDFQGMKMAFFPCDKGAVGGAIIHHEWYTPSDKGTIVYLNAEPDLSKVLSKVEKAGGKIVIQEKLITEEIGYIGVFDDTEGNQAALHSMK